MRAACCEATVLSHESILPDIRLLRALWPDREHAPHAGQFFTLRAWGADEAPFLSRPISVHKWEPETQTIEFLYQVIGEGTHKIAQLKTGDTFQLTGPMGNGFDVPEIVSKYKKIAVVGGGIGTAPLLQLAAELAAQGVDVDLYAGFRDEPYRVDAFSAACRSVHIATDSGRQIFVCGHMEYDRDTLRLEYERDVKRGLPIAVPENYFEDDDPAKGVVFRWRSHANLFFSNWLNYYVYQETPYDLEKL